MLVFICSYLHSSFCDSSDSHNSVFCCSVFPARLLFVTLVFQTIALCHSCASSLLYMCFSSCHLSASCHHHSSAIESIHHLTGYQFLKSQSTHIKLFNRPSSVSTYPVQTPMLQWLCLHSKNIIIDNRWNHYLEL